MLHSVVGAARLERAFVGGNDIRLSFQLDDAPLRRPRKPAVVFLALGFLLVNFNAG